MSGAAVLLQLRVLQDRGQVVGEAFGDLLQIAAARFAVDMVGDQDGDVVTATDLLGDDLGRAVAGGAAKCIGLVLVAALAVLRVSAGESDRLEVASVSDGDQKAIVDAASHAVDALIEESAIRDQDVLRQGHL